VADSLARRRSQKTPGVGNGRETAAEHVSEYTTETTGGRRGAPYGAASRW